MGNKFRKAPRNRPGSQTRRDSISSLDSDTISPSEEANYTATARRKSVFAEAYNPEEDELDEKTVSHAPRPLMTYVCPVMTPRKPAANFQTDRRPRLSVIEFGPFHHQWASNWKKASFYSAVPGGHYPSFYAFNGRTWQVE